jgi:hypothetical protein
MNKRTLTSPARSGILAVLGALSLGYAALAFPPAPHHTIYGLVRNEMGEPLSSTNAFVTLQTATGVLIKTTVKPTLGPGMNYSLSVPMDAGLTADAYKPTALKPLIAFRIMVVIGSATNLPLELHGSYANLGKPAQKTRLDLTLGVDSVGDGLPDAWKRELIATLGLSGSIMDIKPGDDADGDGLSNWAEYIAGTYAFDATDTLRLDIAAFNQGNPLCDFMVIRGRTYSIEASSTLGSWSAVDFRLPLESSNAAPASYYYAGSTHIVRAEVAAPSAGGGSVRMFRLRVQ